MSRLRGSIVVAALMMLVAGARAEDEAPTSGGVAWFADAEVAMRAARDVGRPVWIALHARPATGATPWPHDLSAWQALYRDPDVVAASRAFACVVQLKFLPTERVIEESPTHVVIDADGRVLAQSAGWRHAVGDPSKRALLDLLARGAAAFGTMARDAPVLDADEVSRRSPRAEAHAPSRLPIDAEGLRVRLRFVIALPDFGQRTPDGRPAPVPARVTMTWDDAGPWNVEDVLLEPGRSFDRSFDIAFDRFDGLRALATPGSHRLDLHLGPFPGGPAVVDEPVLVGRAIVEIADGTSSGGGDEEEPSRPDPAAEPPPPEPEIAEGEEPPPPPAPPPAPDRVEVVEPFAADAAPIRKDDAIVAVRDPDAGTEAPRFRPLEEALPDLDRAAEQALRREVLGADDRAYLLRYFDALRARLRRAEGGR